MNSLGEQIIVGILAQEMGLTSDGAAANIWVRNQNRLIPEGRGLFVVVGMVDSEYLGATTQCIPFETPDPPNPPIQGMLEVNQIVARENVQIDLFSRDDLALTRRWEIVAALRSIYSTQQQESNSFKIFRIPSSFVNSSDAEGGSTLNRFSIIIPCHVWYRKEKVLTSPNGDFYDDFKTRVDDEETIGTPDGIFEFQITPEGIT